MNKSNNIIQNNQLFDKTRETIFWSSIRASPIIFNCFNCFNFIIQPNQHTFYFMSSYILSYYLNKILKKSFNLLYSSLNLDYIIPFGQGSRPKNSTNCGYFLKMNNPHSISFGMPSGHCQNTWFFTSYYLLKIWKNANQYSNTIIVGQTVILALLPYFVMFSRLSIDKCHTYGQLIVGMIIGCITGSLVYNYENEIIHLCNNVLIPRLINII